MRVWVSCLVVFVNFFEFFVERLFVLRFVMPYSLSWRKGRMVFGSSVHEIPRFPSSQSQVVVDNHTLVVETSPDGDQVVLWEANEEGERRPVCGPYDWEDHVELQMDGGDWFLTDYNGAHFAMWSLLASRAHCNPPEGRAVVVEHESLHRLVFETGDEAVDRAKVEQACADLSSEAEALGCDLFCNAPATTVLFCRGHVNVGGLTGFVDLGSRLQLGDIEVLVDQDGAVRVRSTAAPLPHKDESPSVLEYGNCAVLHVSPSLFHVAYFVAFGDQLPQLILLPVLT